MEKESSVGSKASSRAFEVRHLESAIGLDASLLFADMAPAGGAGGFWTPHSQGVWIRIPVLGMCDVNPSQFPIPHD